MKCDKCGFSTNLGDQICINCGATLSLDHALSKVDQRMSIPEEKSSKKIRIFSILGVLLGVLIAFLIVFLVMKRSL